MVAERAAAYSRAVVERVKRLRNRTGQAGAVGRGASGSALEQNQGSTLLDPAQQVLQHQSLGSRGGGSVDATARCLLRCYLAPSAILSGVLLQPRKRKLALVHRGVPPTAWPRGGWDASVSPKVCVMSFIPAVSARRLACSRRGLTLTLPSMIPAWLRLVCLPAASGFDQRRSGWTT